MQQRESTTTETPTHTPGPWRIERIDAEPPDLPTFHVLAPNPDAGRSGVPYAGDNLMVASDLDSEEDANLIAAAPDLLESCRELRVAVASAMRVVADLDAMHLLGAAAETREQRFIDEMHASGLVDGIGVRADAAIAKAEGRS